MAKKRGRSRAPNADPLAALASFNPRMMEKALRELFADNKSGKSASNAERAMELIDQAIETPDPDQCVQLAQQALSLYPDCADAYLLLAESACSSKESIDLLRQAVAAGERAVGEKRFKQYAGHFWGHLETRPYMRARHTLANELWLAGDRAEAIDHYRAMIELNPGDNQGVRYVLAACLLQECRDAELETLLNQYADDDSAAWHYTRAVLAFRREGDGDDARKRLRDAMRQNKFVPEFMLDQRPLPPDPPRYIGRGDESEAIEYTFSFRPGWRATPGAIAWLRRVAQVPVVAPSKNTRKRSWRRCRALLDCLPQEPSEVWQLAVQEESLQTSPGEPPVKTWTVLVVAAGESAVLADRMSERRPSAETVWNALMEAMLSPMDKEPRRPGQIEMRPETFRSAWGPRLAQLGVKCLLSDELSDADDMLEFASQQLQAQLGGAGADVSTEELRDLPQQAGETWQADIKRLATWVNTDVEPRRPWLAIVVNRSTDKILAQNLTTDEPTAKLLWETIARAMTNPAIDEPHRPASIELGCGANRAELTARLDAIAVRHSVHENLDMVDFLVQDLSQHLAASTSDCLPGLLDSPGVTEDHVEQFFDAAAAFYRQAPWNRVPGDVVIKVQCSAFQTDTWYAVVMGQSGMSYGLSMYDDWKMLKRLLCGQIAPEEHQRRVSSLAVTFGEEFEMAAADADAADRLGWPVAAPEAYPHALRLEPGMKLRPPLQWELALLEACLRAIPAFLAGHDRKTAKLSAQTHTGKLDLALSVIDES
jgi:tetratricopeptide (TPR) repeat protein